MSSDTAGDKMTINEQLCITKLFFTAMGMISSNTISRPEIEIACEALKQAADQRNDWSDQQKEMYKWLVDWAKGRTEQ